MDLLDPNRKKNVHNVEVGDEIIIYGTAFFLTEFALYHDMPPLATLTSAVEFIKIQKEEAPSGPLAE